MNDRRTLQAVLLAIAATFSCATCDGGADAGDRDWRPCRAATGHRRRYDDVRAADEEDSYDALADSHTGDDDDFVDDADDDQYDAPPPSAAVDDKPKRGVRVAAQDDRPYERRFDRPPYPATAASPSSSAPAGNGLRVDTSLLSGETVELPTYVNVPVTLRCKFVPLDGTDNKFETVVEAMYPGHGDAPPPTPDSHASQILRQLMGSMHGWRGVINKSTRPVRRVVENYRYGWRGPWLDGEDGAQPPPPPPTARVRSDGGGQWYSGGGDVVGRQIAARLRASKRLQHYRDAHLDHSRWHAEDALPEVKRTRVAEDRPVHSRRFENRRPEENQLIEEQVTGQTDDQQVDDQYAGQVDDDNRAERFDGQQDTQVDARQVDGQQDAQVDGQQDTRVDGQQDVQVDGQLDTQVDVQQVDGQQDDRVDDQYTQLVDARQEENTDGQPAGQDDDHPVEQVSGQQDGRVAGQETKLDVGKLPDDRSAEEIDDRLVQQSNGMEFDGVHLAVTTTPDVRIMTTDQSDYSTFIKGIPVKTYVEHAMPFP